MDGTVLGKIGPADMLARIQKGMHP
jgi:hypothetical protein